MSITALDGPAICATNRGTASTWTLLREAAGTPGDLWRKAGSLVRGLRAYLDHDQTMERLARLQALGHIERIPSRLQRFVGSADMLRFWISPNAADYYASRGIGYGLHQVLRVLDDPLSMTDPLGFLSDRDVIVGHLMQVVHANPVYDLQLLESYDGGIEALVAQLEQMVGGTHPRQESIGAIVEEADYHERLLAYTLGWREDRDIAPMRRENVERSPHWSALDATFGSLPTAIRYFCTLPTTWSGAARHLLTVKVFPGTLAA
jgi:hypothetical protein